MSTVLEELDALGAKAAHGQVCNEESYPEDRAARALATLRADHLRPLVAAAEKLAEEHHAMVCYAAHSFRECEERGYTPKPGVSDVAAALAALGRDIAKLKEGGADAGTAQKG